MASVNPLIHNNKKWPNLFLKSSGVYTARFLKYLWPFSTLWMKVLKPTALCWSAKINRFLKCFPQKIWNFIRRVIFRAPESCYDKIIESFLKQNTLSCCISYFYEIRIEEIIRGQFYKRSNHYSGILRLKQVTTLAVKFVEHKSSSSCLTFIM